MVKESTLTEENMINVQESLNAKFPEIAKQWHPDKNVFSPNDVKPMSNKKAGWICEKGHEYYAMIAKRTSRNQECP